MKKKNKSSSPPAFDKESPLSENIENTEMTTPKTQSTTTEETDPWRWVDTTKSKAYVSSFKQESVAQPENIPIGAVKTAKRISDIDIDQELFAMAYKEIETNSRKEGLWAMVYANTENEDEAKKEYINLRAKELHEQELARIEIERKRKSLLKEKEAEEDIKTLQRLPKLKAWAIKNDFVIEEGNLVTGLPSSWKIRKLPFGHFKEFKDDLSFVKHLDGLYKKNTK